MNMNELNMNMNMNELNMNMNMNELNMNLNELVEMTMMMMMTFADCRNLLHQLIEPNPELRIPLAEIQRHPWVTKSGRCPFNPTVLPSRNKTLRNQVSSSYSAVPLVF